MPCGEGNHDPHGQQESEEEEGFLHFLINAKGHTRRDNDGASEALEQ